MDLRDIVLIATAVFDAVLFYEYYKSVLGNARKKYGRLVFYAVTTVLVIVFSFTVENSGLSILLCRVVDFILLLIIFQGSKLVKFFAAILLMAIIQIGDIFTWGAVLLAFPGYISGEVQNPNLIFLFGVTVSYLYLGVNVFIFKFLPSRSHGNLTKTQGFQLVVMPFTSYLIIALLLQYLKTRQINEFYLYLLPSLFFFALLFFIVMFFRNMQRSQENARVSVVLNNQIEQFNKHYETMQASHQLLRERSHDWKNHLLAMKGLADGGDLDGLRAYIGSAYSGIESNTALYTGNPAIDIILRVLQTKCESAGILSSINVKLPVPVKTNTADICVLISNAVDNAYEACEKIAQGERRIDIEIVTDDTYLYFTASNTIQDVPARRKGQFVTSKADTELHGIGLQSIQRIADRYAGHIRASAENGVFTLRCALRNVNITD